MPKNFLHIAITTASSSAGRGYPGCSNTASPLTPRRSTRRDGSASAVESASLLRAQSPRAGFLSPRPSPKHVRHQPDCLGQQIYEGRPRQSNSTQTPIYTPNEETSFFLRSPALLTPFLVQDVVRDDVEETKLGTFSAINIILGKTIGVGIYSVPSSILSDVGSVGMSLVVWILGAAISFCGLSVYLDLGTALPKSGGEKVYLERIFRRPKFLTSCVFMAYVVLLGFSTPNCIVLGEYAMYALGIAPNRWNVRSVAVLAVTAACTVHARAPKLGLRMINVLGVIKLIIIGTIILAGIASAVTHLDVSTSSIKQTSTFNENFTGMFQGTSMQPYAYATALLKALYCFRGYNTANQVLGEVRRPVQTLRRAAPIALSLASAAYILTNIAYLCAVEKTDIASSGVVVAGHFFRNVFGDFVGEHLLPVLVILSAFGSIAATSFAQARVNQELAKQELIPCSRFWASSWPWGTPATGLLLHWLVSVLVIIVPPPGQIYSFLVTLGAYPVSVIGIMVSSGLLYLKFTPDERWSSPSPAPTWAVSVFLVSNMILVVLPWIPPLDAVDDAFPYYAYPAGGCAILASGVLYWAWWRRVKGWLRSFEDRLILGALNSLARDETRWQSHIRGEK
jgi:amino acid transporter